ncbi:hypothetical protein [Thermococcus sp.]|uniref:hypothetical protein n=1 Tax=Thermococcus sp. TaxID=35749 RepID=UPI0026187964|nr:hypothetical protein [Thermococcus sp.]
MTFLSSAFYQASTMPRWMQILAKYLVDVEPTFGIATDWLVLVALALAFSGMAALEFRRVSSTEGLRVYFFLNIS